VEKKTVIIEVQTADGVKELDRLSAKFDEVYGEVLPLTGAIGELEDQLYEMAKAGLQGTKEFEAVAQEAGRLKKVVAEVDMQVDALSMTTANKLGGALGGVTAGFELAQGAMGALGAESEHIEEALLKVQSAMAMAQGVQGIKEAIPAFKSMGSAALKALGSIKGAVMATGIGLLAVAVGLVASNWDKIKESTEKASTSFNDYLNSGTKGAKALKWYLDALVYPITLAIKAYREIKDAILGTSDASRKVEAVQREIHQKRVSQLEKERDTAKKVGEATLTSIDKEIALRAAAGESTLKLEKRKQEAIMETSRQALQGLVQEVKARLALGGVTKEEAENLKKLIEDNKKAYADAAQNLKLIDVQAKKEASDRNKEAIKKREDQNNEAWEKEQQRKKDELAAEEYWSNLLIEEDKNRADKKKELDDKIAKDKEDAAFSEMAFNAKMRQQELEEELALEEKKKQGRELLEKEKYQMAYNSLQLVSDLADLFANEDERKARVAFNVKKAAGIASATINTIEATGAAFKTAAASPITAVFPAYPFIQAGLAAGFGAARVAAIAKTKFEGGGGASAGSAGGGGGGGSTPAASTPANFNIVGTSNSNQIAEGISNTAVKAYVVSGDVSSAQSLDRKKIQTASLQVI